MSAAIPATIQILTNLSCNLDCTYCYEHKDNIVNDLDRIKTYMYIKFKTLPSEQDHVIIDLIGGESFLYPELCESIFEYAFELAKKFKKCVWLSTTTNGTTLKNPKVRDLIVKYKARFSVGVSIDGVKENHDKYRIYKNGKGSYDDAVEYLPWLFETLGKGQVGVKATFTLESFKKYYVDSMLNLYSLGFTDLIGNIVYEEIVPKSEAHNIFNCFKQVIDFTFDNNLEDSVKIFQLGDNDFIRNYSIITKPLEEDSWCGSCTHMSCIGMDGKLYGCNRFCTMDRPNMELGTFDKEKITITNPGLYEDVKSYKSLWPEECQVCALRTECPTCPAASFETEDRQKYIDEKRMCGWTHAITMARFYLRSKLIERDKLKC